MYIKDKTMLSNNNNQQQELKVQLVELERRNHDLR